MEEAIIWMWLLEIEGGRKVKGVTWKEGFDVIFLLSFRFPCQMSFIHLKMGGNERGARPKFKDTLFILETTIKIFYQDIDKRTV